MNARAPVVVVVPVKPQPPKLSRCPSCSGFWVGGLVHAPHFDRFGKLVDCAGKVLTKEGEW